MKGFYDASYILLELHIFSLKHSLAAGHVSPPWSKRGVTGSLDLPLYVRGLPCDRGPRSRHPSPGSPPNGVAGARMFSAEVFCLIFGFLLHCSIFSVLARERRPRPPCLPRPKIEITEATQTPREEGAAGKCRPCPWVLLCGSLRRNEFCLFLFSAWSLP